MTPQAPEVELTPEQLYELDNAPMDLWEPKTPIARLLVDRGLEDWAKRLDRCGHVKPRRCPHHHVNLDITYLCGKRFLCTYCGEELSRHYAEEWRPTLLQFQREFEAFTFLVFKKECPAGAEAIRATFEGIMATLHNEGVTRAWGYISHHDGKQLVCRVLMPGELRKLDWATALDTPVTAVTNNSPHLLEYFGLLVAPVDLPTDEARVDNQVLFHSTHILRAMGFKKLKEEESPGERSLAPPPIEGDGEGDGSESGEVTGDISVLANAGTEKSPVKDTCRVCGCRFTHISSDWVQPWTPRQTLNWVEIPPPKPSEQGQEVPK